MATVYKKKYPIPMPDGAEIITRRGKRLARWQSGKGQVRTAEVLADGRVQFVSDCWYIRYRDSAGRMRRESTGCRDRQAAEKVLEKNPANDMRALRTRLDRIYSAFVTVRKGDTYTLVVDPDTNRTRLLFNGRETCRVKGADFGRAFFGIWLSDYPLDQGLMQDLRGSANGRAVAH